MHLEIDVLQRNGERRACGRIEIASLQQNFVPRLEAGVVDCLDLGADHHAGERGGCFLPRIASTRDLAVAQHRGPVADAAHLFQPMADVEHRAALALQLLERLEQPVGLLRGQHRCRLVEDDEVRVLQQGADDLDALPLADRQIGDMGARIERQAVVPGQGRGFVGDPVDGDPAIQRQGDVLGDGERLEQRKVLEDHADAGLSRLARAADRHRRSAPVDRAGGRFEDAEEHLHQRRLAGTVLAEKRVDFARPDVEVDAVTGPEAAEELGEPRDLQEFALTG